MSGHSKPSEVGDDLIATARGDSSLQPPRILETVEAEDLSDFLDSVSVVLKTVDLKRSVETTTTIPSTLDNAPGPSHHSTCVTGLQAKTVEGTIADCVTDRELSNPVQISLNAEETDNTSKTAQFQTPFAYFTPLDHGRHFALATWISILVTLASVFSALWLDGVLQRLVTR